MKTRFENEQDNMDSDIALAAEQRANGAVRDLSAMRRRIREFHKAIKYVTFPDSENAPAWSKQWFDYLLAGHEIPAVEFADNKPWAESEAELEVVEDTVDVDQAVADLEAIAGGEFTPARIEPDDIVA